MRTSTLQSHIARHGALAWRQQAESALRAAEPFIGKRLCTPVIALDDSTFALVVLHRRSPWRLAAPVITTALAVFLMLLATGVIDVAGQPTAGHVILFSCITAALLAIAVVGLAEAVRGNQPVGLVMFNDQREYAAWLTLRGKVSEASVSRTQEHLELHQRRVTLLHFITVRRLLEVSRVQRHGRPKRVFAAGLDRKGIEDWARFQQLHTGRQQGRGMRHG